MNDPVRTRTAFSEKGEFDGGDETRHLRGKYTEKGEILTLFPVEVNVTFANLYWLNEEVSSGTFRGTTHAQRIPDTGNREEITTLFGTPN